MKMGSKIPALSMFLSRNDAMFKGKCNPKRKVIHKAGRVKSPLHAVNHFFFFFFFLRCSSFKAETHRTGSDQCESVFQKRL